MMPLRRKWQAMRDELTEALATHDAEADRKKRDVLSGPMRARFDEFRRHLGAQRILDPACGSGNFLYVALQQLLDLDDEVVRFTTGCWMVPPFTSRSLASTMASSRKGS